jgi:hypothetical protein
VKTNFPPRAAHKGVWPKDRFTIDSQAKSLLTVIDIGQTAGFFRVEERRRDRLTAYPNGPQSQQASASLAFPFFHLADLVAFLLKKDDFADKGLPSWLPNSGPLAKGFGIN